MNPRPLLTKTDAIYFTEQPEKNLRSYVHVHDEPDDPVIWAVPMDDVPAPSEGECPDCARWLPVLPLSRLPR